MLKSLIQPPGIQLVMLIIALLCWFRYRQLSFALVLTAVVSLYLLSTAYISNRLMAHLEQNTVLLSTDTDAQAIVVLGTGVLGNTPEFDMAPQPGALLIQRLRYALLLQKRTGLPLLVTGGSRYGINEARVMAQFVEEQRGTVKWEEAFSRTTLDNARNSSALLKGEGINRILLVTHAWHMPRAKMVFEREHFKVTAAATAKAETNVSLTKPDAWLPDVRYLRKSQLALHEYIGLIWYGFISDNSGV